MAGIVKSNKIRRLVGNRLKEIDVPTATLDTDLYYADLTAQGASFTQSRVNNELNAYPVTAKNNASLALTPSANKVGVVYAMNGDSKTLEEFEFQRGSSGTYFDASGVIQLADPNVPRMNYENGVAKGLLIEPSSSNLFTDSGLTNGLASVPSKSSVGLTAVDTNFNKGTLLSKGIRVELISTDTVYIYKPFAVNIGVVYTFSVFVKMDDGSLPTSNDIKIVAQGEVTPSPYVINCGNNVYRIVISFVGIKNGTEYVGLVKYTNLSNKRLIATGFQIEQATQVSSYIPTTTAVGTRLADKVLSKRPIVVFPKNSMFVKTAEYNNTWLGNGVSDINIAGRNLITISNDGPWRFSNFSGSSLTKTNNTVSVPEWGIADANRVVTSGGSDTLKTILLFGGTPKIGEVVTISGWFKNNHPTDNLIIDPSRGGMSTTLAPNEQRRVVFDNIPGTGASNVRIRVFSPTVGGYVDFTWSRLQYENGSAATAWSPAPEDYVKTDVNGNIEFVYNEPIHIQQLSLISRELTQAEV